MVSYLTSLFLTRNPVRIYVNQHIIFFIGLIAFLYSSLITITNKIQFAENMFVPKST